MLLKQAQSFLIFEVVNVFIYLFPFIGFFIFEDFVYLLLISIAAFIPLYGFSFSAVYHRLFAHRAFTPRSWVPYAGAAVGTLIFSAPPPFAFAASHRAHHRFLNTDKDPVTTKYGARFIFLPGFFKNSKIHSYIDPTIEKMATKDLLSQYPLLGKLTTVNSRIGYIIFLSLALLISSNLFFVIVLLSFFSRLVTAHINAFTHVFLDNGTPLTIDMPVKALLISSEYNHKYHHDHPGLDDFSANGVKDWTKVAIDKFLSKK